MDINELNRLRGLWQEGKGVLKKVYAKHTETYSDICCGIDRANAYIEILERTMTNAGMFITEWPATEPSEGR